MSARSKDFSRAVFASASTPPPLYEEKTRPTPRPTVLSAGGAPCRRAGPTIHAKHLGEAAPRPSLRQIMHVGEERACECHGEAGVADVAPQPPEAWRSMEAGATEFESSRPAFCKRLAQTLLSHSRLASWGRQAAHHPWTMPCRFNVEGFEKTKSAVPRVSCLRQSAV